MTSEYQTFRKRILEDLTRDDPQLKYRDKMMVVTREWKEHRESRLLQSLTPQEMVTLPFSYDMKRRLQATELQITPEILCLLGKLMQAKEHDLIRKKFKHLYKCKEFHDLKFNEVDLWDILIMNSGGSLILDILEQHVTQKRMKEIVSQLKREDRLGSFMNILVSVLYDKPDLRQRLITLVVKLVYQGMSPNTEFQCGDYTASLPSSHEDRHLNAFEGKPIRYAGTTITDVEYIRRNPAIRGSVRFVGDTVFGFLLQNVCNVKIKNFIVMLLETGLVNLASVVQPYSLSLNTYMDYLTMAFRFVPEMFRNQVCCAIYKNTPKYVLLRSRRSEQFREMAREMLKTNWRGFVLFNNNPRNILHMMLEDGLIDPTDNIFHSSLLLSPLATQSVRNSVNKVFLEGKTRERFYECVSEERYENTIMTSLMYTVTNNPNLHREAVTEMLREYGFRKFPQYHNDSYFSTSDDVCISDADVFVSEDGYVFCRDELEYLLNTKTNPFNRRDLSDGEVDRLKKMTSILDNFWYMFDRSGRKYKWLTYPYDPYPDEGFARLIDGMFEKNDLFTYGARIMDIMEHLNNPVMCILGFTGLVMGVGTVMSMSSSEFTVDQCVSFARCKEDSSDIEDINTFYGIMMNHHHSGDNIRKNFLQWVFLILETTDKFSSSHIMSARLLSLTLMIQMIKMMK